jgi:hypothetical protein
MTVTGIENVGDFESNIAAIATTLENLVHDGPPGTMASRLTFGVSRRSPNESFHVHLEPLVGCGRPARRLLGRLYSLWWQEAEIFSDF